MVYFEVLSSLSTNQVIKTVESIMVYDPQILRPLDPILDYFELISKTAISEFPIVSPDDNKLVLAILSIRDINKLLNSVNDPILPDLENGKMQNDTNKNTFHNSSVDQDLNKNNKIINKLRY